MEPAPAQVPGIKKSAPSLKFIISNQLTKKQIKYDPSQLPEELQEYLAQLKEVKEYRKFYLVENLQENPQQALVWAMKLNAIKVIPDLISMGANINMYLGDYGIYWTPLQWAVEKGNFPMVKVFVENGASVNAIKVPYSQFGITPLHILSKKVPSDRVFCEAAISFLIENKANINAQDSFGNIPLSGAVLNNNIDVVRILLQNKANYTITNICGETPLKQAETRGYAAIIELLKQHQIMQSK